jgi:hypothetical protein
LSLRLDFRLDFRVDTPEIWSYPDAAAHKNGGIILSD